MERYPHHSPLQANVLALDRRFWRVRNGSLYLEGKQKHIIYILPAGIFWAFYNASSSKAHKRQKNDGYLARVAKVASFDFKESSDSLLR